MGFRVAGALVLGTSILLLVSGSIIIWAESGFLLAALAIAMYFFVLPLVTVPILRFTGAIGKDLRCHECGVKLNNPKNWEVEKYDAKNLHSVSCGGSRGSFRIPVNMGSAAMKRS